MSRSSLMRSLQRMGTNQGESPRRWGSTAEEVRQRRESPEEVRRRLVPPVGPQGSRLCWRWVCSPVRGDPQSDSRRSRPKRPAKVAVVGAGVAGLTAALSLKDQGFSDVTVYEANPSRVGGRMWTNTSGFWADYQITEWGGELIDSGHATMRALAKRFGIAEVDILDTPYEDTFYFGSAYYPLAQAELDYRDVHTAVRRDMSSFTWPITWNGNNTAAGIALSKLSIYDWIETRVPGGHESKMGQLIDVAYVIEFGADTRQQSAIDLLGLLGFGTQPSKFQMFGVSDERYRSSGATSRSSTRRPTSSAVIASRWAGSWRH